MPDRQPLFELTPHARKSINDTYNAIVITLSLRIRWAVVWIISALIFVATWAVMVLIGMMVNNMIGFLIRNTNFNQQTESVLLTISQLSVVAQIGLIIFLSIIAAFRMFISELRMLSSEAGRHDR